MAFEHTERWFFNGEDVPLRMKRLLRNLASGTSIRLMTHQERQTHAFSLRCPDEPAVYELLHVIGADLSDLAECAFEQECDDDVASGANVDLSMYPDWDGSFEWILEVSFQLQHEWPLTLLVARALSDKLNGKHYEDLTNEELLAGQTLWMAPPPIVKVSRTE